MMIVITNFFSLPLLMAIWAIDSWLLLASVRLILGKVNPAKQGHIHDAIGQLTDPVPKLINQQVLRWFTKSLSKKAVWLLTIAVVIAVRYIVVCLVISIQQP
jgi:hypothetical protein